MNNLMCGLNHSLCQLQLLLRCVTCAARDTCISCIHLSSSLNLRPYQIKEVRWTEHLTHKRQKNNSYNILAGKIERGITSKDK